MKTNENNPQFLTKSKNRDEDDDDDEESVSLTLDLIIEILMRTPPKSIAKFICVSKLWYTTIRGKYFIDLFLTRSLNRQCFLITYRREVRDRLLFHSASSFHHNNSICTSTTLSQTPEISSPVRGLICCRNAFKVLICNPSTGQVVDLGIVETLGKGKGVRSFLGYDPVDDVYKVLCMKVKNEFYHHRLVVSEEHQVFTLGAKEKTWRRIKCEHSYYPVTEGLCSNGVVYYGAFSNTRCEGDFLLVCFDVRLEEFSLIKPPKNLWIYDMVNYHNKIAFVYQSSSGGEVEIWVLEDVKKQEWSKMYVVVPSWKDLVGNKCLSCKGTISTGEIIFTPKYIRHLEPFFVVYYDFNEDKTRRVDIKGVEDICGQVIVFLNHVENPILL